ncbi:MAG: hypothetical protein ILA07_04745 [Prevotella sp.]|nr:hypothetical protein [Prevotella sp.]
MTGGKGAPSKQRTSQKDQPKKKGKDKDVYISVLFSIIPEDMMKTYKHSKFTIDGKQYESVWMVKPSKSVWKKGKFNKNKINKSLFIDCSELVINLDTGEVNDDEQLMYLMDVTMVNINREICFYKDRYDKVKLHFILGSDTECQDLIYAAHFVCDKTMADQIKDPSFSSFVNSKYSSYFSQYTSKGWTVKVDYCGAYEIKIIHAPFMPSQESGGSSKAKDQSASTKENKKSKGEEKTTQLELLDVDTETLNKNTPPAAPKTKSTSSEATDEKKEKKQLELLDLDY